MQWRYNPIIHRILAVSPDPPTGIMKIKNEYEAT